MRAFIAIALAQRPREHLREVQKAISLVPLSGSSPSIVPPENLHLTLKFLGEVSPMQTDDLIASLRGVTVLPMAMHAEGLDCLPPRGRIRVVAANLAGEVGHLIALVDQIEQCCRQLGFVTEERPYRPHITLARARSDVKRSLQEDLQTATASAWPGPDFQITDFVLMQSTLKAGGAEYRVVELFPSPK